MENNDNNGENLHSNLEESLVIDESVEYSPNNSPKNHMGLMAVNMGCSSKGSSGNSNKRGLVKKVSQNNYSA